MEVHEGASRPDWSREKRKLSELVPWEDNPRCIRKKEAERLLGSLSEFGQVYPVVIGPDDEIYDGHQRNLVWAASASYGPDYEVDVRVSSRALTETERRKLSVYLHRGAVGEFDFDVLADWGVESSLLEWGFDEGELGGFSGWGGTDGLSDAFAEERLGWPVISVPVPPDVFSEWERLLSATGRKDDAAAVGVLLSAVDESELRRCASEEGT
jgi:hypothetical protein